MEIYLTGIGVAVLVSIVRGFGMLTTVFSTKVRNFKRVGLHYNLSTGGFTKEETSLITILFLILDMVVFSPLLSWLSVIWIGGTYAKSLIARQGVPEKVREFNFKMSSADLPVDLIQKYMNEMDAFYGIEPAAPEMSPLIHAPEALEKQNEKYQLESEYGWVSEITIDKATKRYTLFRRTPDYQSMFTSIHEYRIEGKEVLVRTIEDMTEHAGESAYHDIKDNAVLESGIRERHDPDSIIGTSIEDKIAGFQKETEWNPLKNYKVRFFVLSRNTEIISEFEFRKYLRTEYERIKTASKTIRQLIESNGGEVIEEEDHTTFQVKQKGDAVSLSKLRAIMEESNLKKYQIDQYELQLAKEIYAEIELYLDD